MYVYTYIHTYIQMFLSYLNVLNLNIYVCMYLH